MACARLLGEFASRTLRQCVVSCKPYIDILNRFGVAYEYIRRTERRRELLQHVRRAPNCCYIPVTFHQDRRGKRTGQLRSLTPLVYTLVRCSARILQSQGKYCFQRLLTFPSFLFYGKIKHSKCCETAEILTPADGWSKNRSMQCYQQCFYNPLQATELVQANFRDFGPNDVGPTGFVQVWEPMRTQCVDFQDGEVRVGLVS